MVVPNEAFNLFTGAGVGIALVKQFVLFVILPSEFNVAVATAAAVAAVVVIIVAAVVVVAVADVLLFEVAMMGTDGLVREAPTFKI